MKEKEADLGAVYAAISMALFEATELHDEENAIITIVQAPQPYTPWSSKVHTLRQIPVLRR